MRSCRRRAAWLFYLPAALLAACAARAQSPGADGAGPPPAPVEVGVVTQAEIRPRAPFIGTVMSRRDALLAAEVKGRLRFIAEVGTRLQQGAAAARLEDKVYKLEVEAAEAELRVLRTRLEFYEREVERIRSLAAADNAARNQLDRVTTDRDAARNSLGGARARLGLARDHLEKTTLYAPFDGVVAERRRSIGALVKDNDVLLRLVDLEGLEVSARVPAAITEFLHEGAVLEVLGTGARARAGSGRLRAVVPVGDRSRLYELRLVLEYSPWQVGEAVRVLVPRATPHTALLVPRDALVVRARGLLVYRLNEADRAEPVPVQAGEAQGEQLEVQGALAPGERVVTRGNERLRPGQQVRIRPPGGVPGEP